MLSKIYFKCPNCGKVREVEFNEDTYIAKCKCKLKDDSTFCLEAFVCAKETIDNLIEVFYKLNIKWGYDELVWEEGEDEDGEFYLSKIIINGVFCNYRIEDYSNKSHLYCYLTSLNLSKKEETENLYGWIDGYKSLEEAKNICEQDFKERKASNET